MKRHRRNPYLSIPRLPDTARDLLRGVFRQQLQADIERGPVSSQVPITQPTPDTDTPYTDTTYSDTPFSIEDPPPFSPTYPGALSIETPHPPGTGGQVLSPSYSNTPIPSALFQLPAFRQYHANGLLLGDSPIMDPGNTHGYGYQPPSTTQSTSNAYYGTTNAFTNANTLPIEDGATQGQHNMSTLSLQSGDAQSTFYQGTQWQQPQPPLNINLPSFRIRGLNQHWIPIEVRWDSHIEFSCLMESAAMESIFPLTAFETFPPVNFSQSLTPDGLIRPTHWVTVDMEEDIFGTQQWGVPIAIYPLRQPSWTSARLIIGRDLLPFYEQQANASASTFRAPRR